MDCHHFPIAGSDGFPIVLLDLAAQLKPSRCGASTLGVHTVCICALCGQLFVTNHESVSYTYRAEGIVTSP